MKNLWITVLLIVGATAMMTAQEEIKNSNKETRTKTVMQDGKKLFETKTVIEEIQQLEFKDEDADSYEKDLDLDGSNVKVIKTVWIDNDLDNTYDKKISLTYNKAYDDEVKFDTTADGILFTNANGQTMLVKDSGFYVMNPSTDREIYISVGSTSVTY
jgi:hypothetical protein